MSDVLVGLHELVGHLLPAEGPGVGEALLLVLGGDRGPACGEQVGVHRPGLALNEARAGSQHHNITTLQHYNITTLVGKHSSAPDRHRHRHYEAHLARRAWGWHGGIELTR